MGRSPVGRTAEEARSLNAAQEQGFRAGKREERERIEARVLRLRMLTPPSWGLYRKACDDILSSLREEQGCA